MCATCECRRRATAGDGPAAMVTKTDGDLTLSNGQLLSSGAQHTSGDERTAETLSEGCDVRRASRSAYESARAADMQTDRQKRTGRRHMRSQITRQTDRQADSLADRQTQTERFHASDSDEVFIWRATFACERRGTRHTRRSGRGTWTARLPLAVVLRYRSLPT
jgi:hypothetical protein